MNNISSNAVVGFPPNRRFLEPEKGILSAPQVVPIEKILSTFLTEVIADFRPDLIIVIERKSTAILRALKELPPEDRLDWPWRKVISSNEITKSNLELFKGKRLLIFDDMMRRGHHIKSLWEDLKTNGFMHMGEIKIAVFALHEKIEYNFNLDGENIPHYWFYRNLTQITYQSVRKQIVEMLQKAGSLLLDTEHIEVRLRLNCSFSKFLDVLRRRANAIVFNSSNSRSNVTVLYPDDNAHKLSEKLFPLGTECNNIVKKCRIIKRDEQEYSILPMCYPSILALSIDDGWPSDPNISKLLGNNINTHKARFYGVGMLAALDVLKWVLKDISVLDPSEYSLLLPTSVDEDTKNVGYSLDHLWVVFPELNLNELNGWIAKNAKSAISEGKKIKSKWKSSSKPIPLYSPSELWKSAIDLLQVIRHVIDQRIMSMDLYDNDGNYTKHPFGLRAQDIFDLGRSLKFTDVVISALFDILIDEAYIVTHVSEVDYNSEKRMVRSFEPDGEVISNLIRRYTR